MTHYKQTKIWSRCSVDLRQMIYDGRRLTFVLLPKLTAYEVQEGNASTALRDDKPSARLMEVLPVHP